VNHTAVRVGRGPFDRFLYKSLSNKENAMMVLLSSALLAQVTLGTLLWLAIVFFILSIIAFLFGANGVAGMSAGIGRTLMFVFLVLAIIFLIFNFVPRA
jgi:uncharacterized membrane protein YtjA (UPF0391 family)